MSTAAQALGRGIRRVVLAQSGITLSAAAVFWIVRDEHAALAAVYGGGVATLVTVWVGYRAQRAGTAGLGAFYASTVVRYAVVIMLLALGMGALKLAPLALVVAFVVAQFGHLANIRGA